MGVINIGIRLNKLWNKVKKIEKDVSKLKTNVKEGIEISIDSTGTLTSSQYNYISSNINGNNTFHVRLRYFNTIVGVNEYYIIGSWQKIWNTDTEEYDYVGYSNNVQFYVYANNKTYEVSF